MMNIVELSAVDVESVTGGGQVTAQQHLNCVTMTTAVGALVGGVLGAGFGAAAGAIVGAWYGESGACPATGSYHA